MSNPLDRVLAAARASVTAPAAPVVHRQEIAGGVGSLVEDALQRAGVHAPGTGVIAVQALQAEKAEGNAMAMVVTMALEPRYFEIVLYPADGLGAGLHAVALDPGAAYRVRLRAADNPMTPADAEYVQWGVKVRERVLLFLEVVLPASGELAAVDAEVLEFAGDTAAGWTGERGLRLPAVYADSILVLRLRYREVGAGEPGVATERRFTVRRGARAAAAPAVTAPEHAVDARITPPPRTAVLYLESTGPDQVQASGFIPELPNRPQLESFELPAPPAGAFASTMEFVNALTERMDDFSRGGTGKVGPWLEDVLRLYGDDCSLVITDDSGAATPWELFLLTDGTRLGARARVVRWVNRVYRDRPMAWETEPLRVPRRLAVYIHPDAAGTPLDRERALDGDAAQPFTTPEELGNALLRAARAGAPVGLVYLAVSAGLAHDDEEQDALRAMNPPPPGTVRFRLPGVEGKLTLRPLVFANAPYSARVPRAGARPVGLACALLSQVASGYIGALGPVAPELAGRFAEQVLGAAADGEVWPAELLRALRARVMDDTLTAKEREVAMIAFLYVYYGNPHVSIQPVEVGDG